MFSYSAKDKCFIVPYITQSPKEMIEGFIHTPFTKHNPVYQSIVSNSPFAKVVQSYLELWEGFYLLISKAHWKTHIKVVPINHKIIQDYYILRFTRATDEFEICNAANCNTKIDFKHHWYFYKASTEVEATFQKGSKYFTFAFLFEKKWFDEHIDILFVAEETQKVKNIFNGPWAHTLHDEPDTTIGMQLNSIAENLTNTPVKELNREEIKNQITTILYHFYKRMACLETNYAYLPDALNGTWVKEVGKYLESNLTGEFPGIEALSRAFGVSTTKLKTHFKHHYGTTPMQYYSDRQMGLAGELLLKKKSVEEVARTLGYKDAHKFSLRFKKTHGVLPSKYV